MKKRLATVEPVIGTLVNYLGMKKVNTKGLDQSNKCMTLAATAYNIKKLLKAKVNQVIGKVAEMIKSTQLVINKLVIFRLATRNLPEHLNYLYCN